MKRQRRRRFFAGAASAILCVALNINPLATIAGAIADSGIVDRFVNLKNNLIYIAENGTDTVEAATGSTEPVKPGASVVECNCTFTCDAKSAIETLMGGKDDVGGVTLAGLNSTVSGLGGNINGVSSALSALSGAISGDDGLSKQVQELGGKVDGLGTAIGSLGDNLESGMSNLQQAIVDQLKTSDQNLSGYFDYQNKMIHDDFIALSGTIEGYGNTITTQLGEVNKNLNTLDVDLKNIQNQIALQQHKYRVAHLYSINNMSNTSYWRPYSDEVPYVKDFATIMGQFANVYTGYWDANVNKITNPMTSKTSRALEILGYDAIVRYEGVIMQESYKGTPTTGVNGESGESMVYKPLNEADGTGNAYTLATVRHVEIGTDAITWLDAVTLLYKALDQEVVTYQSFMARNDSITPETSPVFQNLSNPVPTIEADGRQHYEGYDFNIFLSRSNIITGTSAPEGAKHIYVYWTKAVQDGFIPASADMDSSISPVQFLQLARKMMIAYGEPEMSLDETKALLQVYGTNYPIQLGVDVADAWAYLKVRGCLSDDVMTSLSGAVSRDDALDICMRIKDEDSRLDYKNIDIVLDIGELLRDDGYFPVYDLEFGTNEFATSVEYDYSAIDKYGYCIAMTNDASIGKTGTLRVCSEKNVDKLIPNAVAIATDYEVDGYRAVLFTVPKNYTGDVWLAMIDMTVPSTNNGNIISGNNGQEWIQLPANCLGGGLYFGQFTVDTKNKTSVVNLNMRHEFDYLGNDSRFIPYADKERASEVENDNTTTGTTNVGLRSDATILEKLAYNFDKYTSPMTAQASFDSSADSSDTEPIYDITLKFDNDFRVLSKISYVDGDTALSGFPSGVEILKPWTPSKSNIYRVNTDDVVPGVIAASKARSLLVTRLYSVGSMPAIKDAFTPESNFVFSGYSGHLDSNMQTPNNAITISDIIEILLHERDLNGLPYNTGTKDLFDNRENKNKLFIASYVLGLSTWESPWYMAFKTSDDGQWQYNDWVQGYVTPVIEWANSNMYIMKAHNGVTSANLNVAAGYADGIPDTDSELSKTINNYVADMYNHKRIKSATATSVVGGMKYSFKMRDEDCKKDLQTEIGIVSAARFDVKAGYVKNTSDTGSAAVGSSEIADIHRSVCESIIMSRDEAKLFKWQDLVNAGVVYPTATGGEPKLNGQYYTFYSYAGLVRVNDIQNTIQIGTTLYDLMPANGQDDIVLVYCDNDNNGEMYIDVRCVMGVCQYDFKRDPGKAIKNLDSIGAGDMVVYSLNSDGLGSPLFTKFDINCYNFPEIPNGLLSTNLSDDTVPVNAMPMIVYSSTIYDNYENAIPDQLNPNGANQTYWPDLNVSRLGLSSFAPVANWIMIIDQDAADNTSASLFVYYPIAPFENGYANTSADETSLKQVKDPGKDWESLTVSQSALVNQINNDYGSKMNKWYIQMTIEAIQHMYEKTGFWYFGPNVVIREFKLQASTVANCDAWNDWDDSLDGGDIITVKVDPNDTASATKAVYKNGGNSVGAIYWLEGIGFVYNMPTVEEFSLEKYLNGVYPLPIACTGMDSGTAAKIGLINYNLNYWGQMNTNANSGDVKVFNPGNSVPYGYTLTGNLGYVNYKDFNVLTGGAKDNLPPNVSANPDAVKDSSLLMQPFYPASSDVNTSDPMQLAPTGVYYKIGTLAPEKVYANGLSQVITNSNLFFYGSSRITLDTPGQNGVYFYMISKNYNPIMLSNNAEFYRVYRNTTLDVLVCTDGLQVGASNPLTDVIIDDYQTLTPDNPLDNFGVFSKLLDDIDEGTSLFITIAFVIIPMVGIIFMTILIGLAFLGQNRVVKDICEKTIDPVRLLTFGHQSIETWEFKRVIFPCILLYILFALFLNGNVIRLIGWVAQGYATVMKYAKGLF